MTQTSMVNGQSVYDSLEIEFEISKSIANEHYWIAIIWHRECILLSKELTRSVFYGGLSFFLLFKSE